MDDKSFLSPELTQQGGHMILQNVKKTTKIKFLNIDTRYQGDYNLNKLATFTYNLPQRITEIKSIAVRSVEIPMSFYSFSINHGNTFMKIDNSSIVIPNFSYTTNDNNLKTQLNSQFVSQISPTNFTLDISFNRTTITNTSNTTRNIYFDVDSSGGFNKYNFKSSLGWCLGYRLPEYSILPNKSLVAEGLIDVNPIRYLFLVVDEFRQSNPNSFISPLYNGYISKNVLARITLNPTIYPFGTILPANIFNGFLLSDQRYYSGKTDIQKLQIQLVDEWGEIVDLNQLDFSFCLEIECE
jgi:hypothetical protein